MKTLYGFTIGDVVYCFETEQELFDALPGLKIAKQKYDNK